MTPLRMLVISSLGKLRQLYIISSSIMSLIAENKVWSVLIIIAIEYWNAVFLEDTKYFC